MTQVLDFSGRLTRSDKRPANPGRYDLAFALHQSGTDDAPLWTETARGVDIVPGGFYRVVLGRTQPLRAQLFAEGPRWLSVRVVRGRATEEETGPRVPVSGAYVALAERVANIESGDIGGEGGGSEVVEELRALLDSVEERLESLETELESSDLDQRLKGIGDRVGSLDDEEDGRVVRIEDELEDLIGPDGDVVDLNERMDRLEGRAPQLIASLRQREAEMSRERVGVMRAEVDQLSTSVGHLREFLADLRLRVEQVAERPVPTPDDVGAVSRQGDVMTGGLVINRGGLEVLSGGVVCRGATVNSLEASNLIKAPKVIADAFELRGDLTVDNTHRALQVRLVEGRQGSSRKDGALYLNHRGGAEVVVGNAAESKGLQIHGPVLGASYQADGVGFAQAFDVYGSIEPGQVACMRPDGTKVESSRSVGDPAVIGVCVESAGISTGGSTVGGRALVALAGVATVTADASSGAIAVGDLLVAGPDGKARKAAADAGPGAVLGKAVGALAKGIGGIAVLVGAR